jgi:hypothetical protein
MGLENKIHLPGKPEPRVPEMREHRFRTLVGGRFSGRISLIDGSRLGRRIWLRRNGRVRLLRKRRHRRTNSHRCPKHKQKPAYAEIRELGLRFHVRFRVA